MKCSTCGRKFFLQQSATPPFCSERCQLIDLGTASILGPKQGDKIYIQKFRRRKHSKKRTGHRPLYTRVRIESIGAV